MRLDAVGNRVAFYARRIRVQVNPKKALTREDVARAAGVSAYTVSQSLAGRVGPSAETRKRVLAVAAELGYRVNTVASLLARHGSGARTARRFSVALLSPSADPAFAKICDELGIDGQWVEPRELGTPEAASRLLWSRGFDGVHLSLPRDFWSAAQWSDFEWERFSVVKTSRGDGFVPCHLVRHSAFDYMTLALREVTRRGFRRIAVVLHPSSSFQDDDARYGAFVSFRDRRSPKGVQMVCLETPLQPGMPIDRATLEWLENEAPDALLVFHQWMAEALLRSTWNGAGKIPIAAVLTDGGAGYNPLRVSGCDFQAEEHVRRALTILVDLMGHGERGFPKQPLEHVIEPIWFNGATMNAGR